VRQVPSARAMNRLRILTYHRIAPYDRYSVLTNVSATPAAFAAQMRWLRRRYHVVGLEEVRRAATAGARLPERAVLITFDDAYEDFARVAWPVLQRHGFPVILFVPTAFPSDPQTPFWWDRLKAAIMLTREERLDALGISFRLRSKSSRYRAYRQILRSVKRMRHEDGVRAVSAVCNQIGEPEFKAPSVLDWPALRNLANEGVTLGAHTRTHPIMTRIPRHQIRSEVVGSREDLRREIGADPLIFAYPSGDHNEEVIRVLREEAFILGVTTETGHNDLSYGGLLRLRRINITPRTTLPIFQLKLSSIFGRVAEWLYPRKLSATLEGRDPSDSQSPGSQQETNLSA
jgi:peptidoglycan/xylan/chitin deacetylase (PgdA/CDA1 family)